MRTFLRIMFALGATVLMLALPASAVADDHTDGGYHEHDGDHQHDDDHQHDGDHKDDGHYPPSTTVPHHDDDHHHPGDEHDDGDHKDDGHRPPSTTTPRHDDGDTGPVKTDPDVGDSEAGGAQTVVLPETEVAGEVAQDSDTDGTPAELAITGRSFGGVLGVAVLAIVVGGVLIVLSRRREGISV